MLFSKCQAKIQAGASKIRPCGQGSPMSGSYCYEYPHFAELFWKAQMPPCTVRHDEFHACLKGGGWGIGFFSSGKQKTGEMFMSISSAQVLLGLPLPLKVASAWMLESYAAWFSAVACFSCDLCLPLPSSEGCLFFPPLLVLSEESVVLDTALVFHTEDMGSLLTWISDFIAQEFLVAWVVIKAHCLQAQLVMSKMILTVLQLDCFKGDAVL